MRIVTSNIGLLRDTFKAVSSIVDTVMLLVDDDGVRFSSVDDENVRFIHFELNYTFFDEYESDDGLTEVGVDAGEVSDVLRRARQGDILTITMKDDSRLVFLFEGESKRRFSITLTDEAYTSSPPVGMVYPVCLEVEANVLRDALKDCSLFAESFQLTIDHDHILVKCDGGFGGVTNSYLHGETVDGVVSAKYSIKYLEDILQPSKFNDVCILEMGDDMPLRISFMLPSGDGEFSSVLAPRIEGY